MKRPTGVSNAPVEAPLTQRLAFFFLFFFLVLPAAGSFSPTRRLQTLLTRRSCFKPFEELVVAKRPDVIVSVHPLCQDIPLRVREKLARAGKGRIPFVTVPANGARAAPHLGRSRAVYGGGA